MKQLMSLIPCVGAACFLALAPSPAAGKSGPPAAETKKLVVSIVGMSDEAGADPLVIDRIMAIKPMTEEFLNKIGVVKHQSGKDIMAANSALEFIQIATSASSSLGDQQAEAEKIKAAGVDKFIWLSLIREIAVSIPVDVLYAFVVDARTRDFSIIPLGTYDNKALLAASKGKKLKPNQIIRKTKIAKDNKKVAATAAQLISVFVHINTKRERDIAYRLEDTHAAMDRNSYGKNLATIIGMGTWGGGLMVGSYFAKTMWADKNVGEDGGKMAMVLSGLYGTISCVMVIPTALGVANMAKRFRQGVQYRVLEGKYKKVAGREYELPKVPRR